MLCRKTVLCLLILLQTVKGFYISNTNDLSPLQIKEEQPIGTFIIKVLTSVPADEFELTDNSAGYFSINSSTGEIFIQKRIDKEVVGNNFLTAKVIARKTGSLTANAILSCLILDINDVVPSFSKRLYTLSVSEKTSVNKVIFTEKAVDGDSDVNGQVTYKIVSGNEDGTFAIDFNEARVSLSRDLDYETKTQYLLNITAQDVPGLSNWTLLMVNVLDANDLPAKFTAFSYSAEVSEDAALGTNILQVFAYDLDKGINDTATYKLDEATNPSRLFVITNITGFISLNGSLDRETISKYNIRVLAYSSYPVTDHATVAIKVTDVNDNRPVFTKSEFRGTVGENLNVGTSVLQVEATDRDQGINAELRYHIQPSIDSNRFSINQHTGVVSTAAELDREQKDLYNLTVVVEDMNGNATLGRVYNNTAIIYISIKDVNDNAPVFTNPSYIVTINETITVGSKVIQLEAKDPDVVQDIVYSISSGNELSRFLIGRKSGVIYTRSIIDRDPPGNETVFYLEVMAIDNKNALLNSTANITVKVNDVNDNRPQCSQDEYSASVYENATLGTVVTSLSCSDLDTKNSGRLTYELVSGADRKFAINSTSGLVYVVDSLDYDNGNKSYTLELLVTDNGQPQLSREVSVVIDVININDNSPVFNNNHYDFSILEGDYRRLSVLVGKVEAKDGDADSHRCLCAQIRYDIINSTGIFTIDPVTGELRTSSLLDRESVSSYTLIIKATDRDPWRSLWNFTTVVVHIVDQNDNSPIFIQVNYTANVAEDKEPGYHVIKVEATDKDIGQNANITYTIVNGNIGGVFNIDGVSGLIMVATTLDHETINRYILTIAATDGGTSPRQTTVSVFIDITDVNDNQPVCLHNQLTVKVKENLPAGQIVTKVSVIDKDEGLNQKTLYHLVSDWFAVNPVTGDVNTTRPLDRENQSEYTLTVIAYNYNQSSMTVNCSVRVLVEDVNDNTPRFNTSSIDISVPENTTVGTSLLRVTASDEDEAHNGEVRYTLIGDGTKFTINDTTGIIRLLSILDREETSHYTLQIVARDRGLPQSRSSMVRVLINVTDVNDNRPVFDQTVYSSSVPENSNGTIVMTVAAKDRDQGSNSNVDYSIIGGNTGNAFSINSSGTIITVTPLDRETKDQYQLTIRASDRGVPVLDATVKAIIRVLDVNDNRPNITNTPRQITIQENTPTGSLVYLLTADDKDLGLNAVVTYTSFAEPSGIFAINPSTGMITTVGSLDRETASRYQFHSFVSDQGNPPLNSSVVSFDIIISDLNDNNPVFNPASYTVNISEDVAIETIIIRVNATEKDSGQEGRIGFKIVAGDAGQHFIIDNTTGVIRNRKSLDRESSARYSLVISAEDYGSPARCGHGYVTINIQDTNDLAPVFSMNQYSSVVKEDVSPGTAVITVRAVDGDLGSNSKILYSLVNGEEMLDFNITTDEVFDPDSLSMRFIGRIKSARDLDRELRASYNLTVMATDGVHNTTAQAIITIEDVNDNSPRFILNSSLINISLAENTPGGTKILNVTARDIDEGFNARISYSLSAGDGKFYIDSNTGVLFTTPQSLDRETKDLYNLTVTASDPANNRATVSVIVHVLDVNDNPPRFNSSIVTVYVDEGTDDVILDVIATDIDQGTNQEIDYRIISGNDDGTFEINKTTGNLRSVKYLDRERSGLKLDRNRNGIYSLVIEAADHGQPQLSSKTNVIITVKDINDNAPVFQHSLYSYEIAENTSIGEVIGTVKADDKDLGTNSQVLYSILSTGNVIPFAVDPSTGVLTVNNSLDRETTSSYKFIVKASDTGYPSLNGTTTVKITIQDINDNKPIFGLAEYNVTIPENTPGGSVIVRLDAKDSDEGSNGKVGFVILDGSREHFIIEESTGTIRTVGNLDYEINQSYSLNVSGFDHGRPSLWSTVLVFIIISDYNDHAPVFNQSQYSVDISEDTAINSTLLLVHATDSDQGANAQIIYTLVENFQVFDVNNSTGRIFVKKQLDREDVLSYQIQVKATDNGINKLSSIAVVTVSVTDVNDNWPLFSNPKFYFETNEDAFSGAFIGTVKATDRDIGDNGRLNYTINQRQDIFQIDLHVGALSLVRSTIGLANQNISLVVTCRDNGRPSLSSNVTVYVYISTGSKKVPKLMPRHLNVSVYENATVGEVIAKLNASDQVNSNLEYTLLAGDRGKFYLNTTSGVLNLIGSLDRETKDSYTITILVKDLNMLPYSDYGSVVINILDINDNSPRFAQNSISVSVPENISNGSKIVQATATDPDEGVNGEVFYYLQGNGSKTFHIDNTTGKVLIKTSLDYESTQSYTITVLAENTLSPVRLRSFLTLTVDVQDVVDNKPTFTRDWLNTSMKEDVPIGSFVIDVNATLDDKKSSYIAFRLIHDQSSNKSFDFTIEPESGVIRSQVKLDRESTSTYTLVVEARDLRDSDVYKSTAHVTIDILDVNDNNPFFPQKSYNFFPEESSSVGDVIGQIQARDYDKGENAVIVYELVGGNGSFGINSSTGILFISKLMDFESQSTYSLYIRAYDKQKINPRRARRQVSSPDYDEATVTVQVQDENDNPPTFTQLVYLGSCYPETPESTILLTVKAIDKDTNSIVRYYSSNESFPGVLSMNSLTGHLTHNKSVLNETTTTYSMYVTARDNNGTAPYNSARNTATVMVFYLNPSTSLTLTIGVPLYFVNANRQQLLNLLSDVTGHNIFLKSLQKSQDDPSQTIAIIHLVNNNSMTVLSNDEANRVFFDKSGEIETRYPDWNIKVLSRDTPRIAAARRTAYFSFYIGAIMVIGALIGIAGLVGLLVICRYKYREKNNIEPDSNDMMMEDRTDMTCPRIGAYIESRAGHPGLKQKDVQHVNRSNHQSSNEELHSATEPSSSRSATPTARLLDEEQTIVSVLSSGHETSGLSRQSRSQDSRGEQLNNSSESQPNSLEEIEKRNIEDEKNESQEENITSTGSCLNKAYEDTECMLPSNQSALPNNINDPDDSRTMLFVSRNPFSRISSGSFSPGDFKVSSEDTMAPKTFGPLISRPPRKSDSYSPAIYKAQNNKTVLKRESENGGHSPATDVYVYDIQKKMKEHRKKKRKHSSRVRFDLNDVQHPDELEWERQTYINRNMPDVLASSRDSWQDVEEPLGFFTFRRSRNESKTDDSPESSISNGDDCEISNLDDEGADDSIYPPSGDENMTTYVINPAVKKQDDEGLVTEL